jgi:hypothetical protein
MIFCVKLTTFRPETSHGHSRGSVPDTSKSEVRAFQMCSVDAETAPKLTELHLSAAPRQFNTLCVALSLVSTTEELLDRKVAALV